MIPYNPNKRIVVEIEKKFLDLTNGGIYRETRFNPEEWVTCYGNVLSIPSRCEIDIKVGDRLYFSYQVLTDITEKEHDTPLFNNVIIHDNKEYVMVEEVLCYFRIRGEQIKMLNGYVLLNILTEEAPKTTLVIPEHLKSKTVKNKAKVLCIDEPNPYEPELDIQEGDVVGFDKKFIEHYPLTLDDQGEKDYFISEQSRILCKYS